MRRAVFYLFFDPAGQVDDYVTYKLQRLRSFAEHIFVVSNSELDEVNRAKLESVADTVWTRENVGLDVWAYKEALQLFGESRMASYDELILMNYTFFGPIGGFDELFADMDARDLDFWGITEHDEVVPHPFDSRLERLERHLQSHWIGVRASMFTSEAWHGYWQDMPMIRSYSDSVNRHEGIFTSHFESAGFRKAVAYSVDDYPSRHPVMDDTVRLLRDGCPIVKRRSFFADPLYMERHAISGRATLDMVEASGYPVDLLLSNLARTTEPRVLATNLSLLEVLPLEDQGGVSVDELRVAAVAHIYYPEMTGEILDRFACLPEGYDLYVTTADDERRLSIEETLRERGVAGEVRVVASNRGRDVSAFLIACRDVLEPGRYDLVVKLHSKKSLQDAPNLGDHFKHHLFDNLLASPGYAANLLRLFVRYPSLGMVLPPTVHIGYPTLGHAWYGNKERAAEEAKRIGITVPFDATTPLATYGSMFIARPEALRPLSEARYEYDAFPDETGYGDGAFSHVVERLMSYASLSEGFHLRQALTPGNAALNYSFLEFKHQAITALLPGYPSEQLGYISKLRRDNDRLRRLLRRRRNRDDGSGGARTERVAASPELSARRRSLGEILRPSSSRRGST